MSRKTLSIALGLAALALAAGLGPGGCGGRGDWYAGIYDLSAVTPSADLRPAIEEALVALAGPEPRGPVVDDLDRYQDLMLRIQRTQTREQAGDELYARWASRPTHVLWIELAVNYNYLLRRTAALDSMCARPELSDTTSAIEAFVTGRRRYLHGDRGENYRRAEARMAELDALQQVWLTMKLAVVDFDAGDPVGAVRRLLGGIPLARATGGSRLEISLWRSIARFLYRIDRLDDALCASVLATAQARKVGYDYRALQGRVQLASIMSNRREYEGALALFEECAAIATERDFPWLISSSLDKAAAVSGVLGDHGRALELDRRNLDYSLAMNDSLLAPRKMVNLAYDFRVQGQLDSCRTYLARARRWIEAFDDDRNKAGLPIFEAQYHCQLGAYDVADSLLAVAGELAGGAGKAVDEARLLLDLIRQGLEMGQPDLAYRAIARLEQLRDTLHDRGPDQNLRADFEIATADLLGRQGEFRLATEALARAEQAVASGGGEGKAWDLQRSRGELALLREDLGAAREAFTACVELARAGDDQDRLAASRFHLGHVLLEQGEHAAARALFREDTPDSTFGPRFRTRLSTLLFLGVSHAREGDHAAAIAAYRRTQELLTPYSPADLVARLRLELGRSLAAVGSPRAAERELQRARSTLLLTGDRSLVDELRAFNGDALREVTEVLIGLYVDHPGLLPDRDVGRRTLRIAAESRQAVTGEAPRPAASARAGSPLLVFLVGLERSFRWTVTPAGTALEILPGRRELRRLVAPVLADMMEPSRTVDAAAAERLAGLLLGGVDGIWEEGADLRIAPDGLLSEVPWGALPLPQDGRPLIARGPLVEIPSGPGAADAPGAHGEATPRPASLRTLLAIGSDGAPAPGGVADDLPALRQAEREARRVASLWSGERPVLRTGDAAAWERIAALDLARFDVIHVASHATVHQGLPRRSTLRLSGGDGAAALTIPAVRELTLDADLVYLSCCEAARRLASHGGGAADFAHAFLAAGARTVIASTLWVDDEAGAFLAESFYRHWLGGQGRAAALRAAQLELQAADARWRHPCYWAFFRLIGEGA